MQNRTMFVPMIWILLLLPGALCLAQEPLTRTYEASLDYNDVSRVEADLFEGELSVQTWEQWRVGVESTCRVDAASMQEAEAYLDKATLDAHFSNEVAHFELKLPPTDLQGDVEWRHTLYLPAEVISAVEIHLDRGRVQLHGMHGEWNIDLGEGQIELFEVTGAFQISVKRGGIAGQILFSGVSRFEVMEGDLDLAVLDALPQPLDIEVTQGDVRLTLPENYPAQLDARTTDGKIVNQLPLQNAEQETPQQLQGVLAQEGPPLNIEVAQGDIYLQSTESVPEGPAEPAIEPPPPLAVPIRDMQPTLDGILGDAVWRSAARIAGFYTDATIPSPDTSTEAYISRDAQYLYLAARLRDPDPHQLLLSQTARDADLSQDDMLLWRIVPGGKTVYELQVTPLGTLRDQRIEVEPESLTGAASPQPWNPEVKAAASVGSEAWYAEVAIPLDAFDDVGEDWGMNIQRYRAHAKELSVWPVLVSSDRTAPAMDMLADLRFVTTDDTVKPWTLSEVHCLGLQQITESALLDFLGLSPGAAVLPQELPEIEQALRDLDLFSEVTFRFEPVGDQLSLEIEVTERDLLAVDEVEFSGNHVLPGFFLRERLRWQSLGWATSPQIDLQSRLIENLYQGQGYSLVRVGWEIARKTLKLQVDEGVIEAVRIEGTHRIPGEPIRERLMSLVGQPYREGPAEQVREEVLDYLSQQTAFEQIERWEPIREEERWVLAVSIREQGRVRRSLGPRLDFNRVQGLVLGSWTEVATYPPAVARAFGMFEYGFSNERWNYMAGTEKRWFDRYAFTVGADMHRLADTPDAGLISENEGLLAALLWGDSYQDYYQREGMSVWASQQLTPSTRFQIEWSRDEETHLWKTTNWSLFQRDFPKRSNRRIWEGQDHRLRVSYHFDSRDQGSHVTRYFREVPIPDLKTTTGWLGYLAYERAGDWLGGDFAYHRGEFLITRYQPLPLSQALDVRFMGAIADRSLPPQKRAYVGGIGTLRGYEFKERIGDNMLLANVDWRWRAFADVRLALFADVGYVWQQGQRFDSEEIRAAIGVGVRIADAFRLDVAQPLESGRSRAWLLRIDRMY